MSKVIISSDIYNILDIVNIINPSPLNNLEISTIDFSSNDDKYIGIKYDLDNKTELEFQQIFLKTLDVSKFNNSNTSHIYIDFLNNTHIKNINVFNLNNEIYKNNLNEKIKLRFLNNSPNKSDIYNIYFNDEVSNSITQLSTSITPKIVPIGTDIAQSFRNNAQPIELINYISYDQLTFTFNVLQSFIWPWNQSLTDNMFILLPNETFNGNHHTIYFGQDGKGANWGIFNINSTANDYSLSPTICNLHINSTIVNLNNISTTGGGGFVRYSNYNFKMINCHHLGDINGTYSGGMCAQPLNLINLNSITNITNIGIYLYKCSQIGNVTGNYNGGLVGGGIYNAIDIKSMTINITIYKCQYSGNSIGNSFGGLVGDSICCGLLNISSPGSVNILINVCKNYSEFTSIGNNCGGLLGGSDSLDNSYYGGCILTGFYSSMSMSMLTLSSTINLSNNNINCNFSGYNCGGLCGGGNNNYENDNLIGSGCIFNGSILYTAISNIKIKIKLIKNNIKGTFNGNNSGGLLAGGDNIIDNGVQLGSGCLFNRNTFYNSCIISIKLEIYKCNINANFIGNNCGGLCAGSTNYETLTDKNNTSGCMFNNTVNTSLNSSISTNNNELFIKKCKLNCNFNGNNCGGLSGGSIACGNYLNIIQNSNNVNLNSIININIINNKMKGKFSGNNCGGLCSGSELELLTIDNTIQPRYGGGAIANGNIIGFLNQGNVHNITNVININFDTCKTVCDFLGNNCGGIIGGSNNNGTSAGGNYGGGCMGNGNVLNNNLNTVNINLSKLKHYGNFTGNNCGGICGGGDNYYNGGGCMFNGLVVVPQNSQNNSSMNSSLVANKLKSYGNFNGYNCGGLFGGGENYFEGGGCILNGLSLDDGSQISNLDIKHNYFKGSIHGNNSGGLCAGGNCYRTRGGGSINNGNTYNYQLFTNSNNTNIFIKHNETHGSIYGKNSGGILAGGDIMSITYNTNGAGACSNGLKNTETSLLINLFLNIYKCESKMNIIGKNSGGICAGGDIIINNIDELYFHGAGSICNGSTLSNPETTIKINLEKCKSHGKIQSKNCGGICGGGDISSLFPFYEGKSYGAGCMFNGMTYAGQTNNNTITCTIIDCHSTKDSNEDLYSNVLYNYGGILAGGDSGDIFINKYYGGGCLFNYSVKYILNMTIYNCSSVTKLNYSNSGGICGGGDMYDENGNIVPELGSCVNTNNQESGFYCNMGYCKSSGSICGYGSGGLLARYIGRNNDNCAQIFNINECHSTGEKIGHQLKNLLPTVTSSNCGGLIGGYLNGSDNNIITTIQNCYTKGKININCGGFIGQGNVDGDAGPYVNISYGYASGDNNLGFSFFDPSLGYTIDNNNTYDDSDIYKITGSLDNLSKLVWKKHKHGLPTLKDN